MYGEVGILSIIRKAKLAADSTRLLLLLHFFTVEEVMLMVILGKGIGLEMFRVTITLSFLAWHVTLIIKKAAKAAN